MAALNKKAYKVDVARALMSKATKGADGLDLEVSERDVGETWERRERDVGEVGGDRRWGVRGVRGVRRERRERGDR